MTNYLARWKTTICLINLSLLGLGSGCTTVLYTPVASENHATMGFLTARKTIAEGYEHKSVNTYQPTLKNVLVTPLGIRADAEFNGEPISRLNTDFKRMDYTSAEKSLDNFYVRFRNGSDSGLRQFTDQETATSVAKALNSLIFEAKGGNREKRAAEFEAFKQQAKVWRELAAKPAYPPEVERRRILTEHAVAEKKYDEALEHLEAGLAAAPMWPEGHYNAALLYAEIEAYRYAAEHMRRYLELMPNAPEAAAMREKLIVWEDKAK